MVKFHLKGNRFIKVLSLLFIAIFSGKAFADIYSMRELIPAGHWVYDAIFVLNNETKRTSFATNSPLSAEELKMYFDLIPYESLSDDSKIIYDEVLQFFNKDKPTIDMKGSFFGFNVNLFPVLLYKTNNDIDWSFSTDYTGHVNSVKESYGLKVQNEGNDYGAASNYFNSNYTRPFLSVPLYLGWGDYFFIYTEPCYAKSYWAMSEDDNFTNLAYSASDLDFLWPRNAYGITGKSFNGWGVDLSFARQGLQIGKTLTGSVIYNSTFETDGYFKLNLYSHRMKYNLDLVQVSTNKYMYLHSIEARPLFNWIRFGITEGSLVYGNFELKHLNPIMIMHSYGAWEDKEYFSEYEAKNYGEANVCQYMGVQLELTPIKNTRFYALYAQNELQPPNELGSDDGNAIPDGFAWQLGFELTVPHKDGWFCGSIEGVYTSPFCYIKQGADWSLYRKRYNMQSNSDTPICSWIGSPFGPDAIGASTKISYTKLKKWNASLGYLFVAHGTDSFSLFENYYEAEDGNKYYAYYPSVLYKLGLLDAGEAKDIARSYKLTGTVQFTNQITAQGSYSINKHLEVDAELVYSFIFNNKNKKDEFAQGLQGSFGLVYNLF